MELDLFVTPGLGDNTYLLTSGDEAAIIDPQRDVERFVEAARARGARVVAAIETHVHNDYVSGASELREATGARIVGPAGAGYGFAFTPVQDGSEIQVGDARLLAISTPGHTPEHTSYVLHDGDPPTAAAVFSGGSLIVGSAGRTDLLGPQRTDELSRAQFATVRRLGALGDDVALLPTHGAGSFCASTPPGRDRTSTIGAERLSNPALAVTDEASFLTQQLSGLTAFPTYYAHMAPINRRGPTLHGAVPMPPPRTADEVATLLDAGAWLVDARDGASFAGSHVPGALNIPLEASFGSYVGWLVPFGARVVLMVPERDALVEVATQLFRIGYEEVAGYLDGGTEAWAASGRGLTSYPTITIERLIRAMGEGRVGTILDVRMRGEWDRGHLEGSRHVFVGDLPGRLETFEEGTEVTVVCASGYRSAMAASLLDRQGVPVRLVSSSGVPNALRALRTST